MSDAFAARPDIRTAANKARTAVFAHRDGLEECASRPMLSLADHPGLAESSHPCLLGCCRARKWNSFAYVQVYVRCHIAPVLSDAQKLDLASELRLASYQAADVMHSDGHPIELAAIVESERISQAHQFEWSGFIYGNAWRPIGRSDNMLHRNLKLVLTVSKLVLGEPTDVKQDHRDALWEDTDPRVHPQHLANAIHYRRRATADHEVRRQWVVLLATAGKANSRQHLEPTFRHRRGCGRDLHSA
jgi:hypothetical protein